MYIKGKRMSVHKRERGSFKFTDFTPWSFPLGRLPGCLPAQEPDPDLGKSIYAGTLKISPERVFGTPTIRTDITPPKSRSVADIRNHGNEPNAFQMMYRGQSY